jgi:hypothetical protein
MRHLPLCLADVDHGQVGGRGELLLGHRGNVMPRLPEEIGATLPQVLVELELHAFC